MADKNTASTNRFTRITFSKKQSRIIANAVSLLALSVFSVIVSLSLFYSFQFISAHSSVLLPPIVAIICAKVVQPAYDALRQFFWRIIGRDWFRLRSHRQFFTTENETQRERIARSAANTLAIIVLAIACFVPLGVFLWHFGQLLVSQVIALVDALPSLTKWVANFTRKNTPQVLAFVETHNLGPALSKLDPANWFDPATLTSNLGDSAFTIWDYARTFLGAILGWIALPIYTAIYLASRPLEGSDVSKLLVGVSEKTRNNVKFLIDEFIRIVVTFFRGQVLVAFIQGMLFGIGFQFIAGLSYGMAIGLILGICNIVPYLGNIAATPIIAGLALFGADGSLKKLGLVILVFVVGQAIDGYFITPKIMSHRTGLNAFVIIFSLFFWHSVIGGILGLVLAIPLSAFVVVFWRLLIREYFQNPALKSDEIGFQ